MKIDEWGNDCAACGDPATKMLRGKPLCRECWLELAKGVINMRPARNYRSSRGRPNRKVEND